MREIRVRAGGKVRILTAGGEITCACTPTQPQVEQMAEALCEHALYARAEEQRQGFVTLRGGHRMGLCGRVVAQGQSVRALRDISSLCLRVAGQWRGAADALPPSMISTAFSPSTACRWFPRNTGTRCTEIRPTRSARMKRAFKPCARWHATWPGCSNAWRPAVRQACPSPSRKRLFAPILSDKSRFRKGSGLNQLPQNRQLFFAQMDSRLTQRQIGMLHQKRMAHAVQHGFIVEVVAKSGSFFL